MMRGYGYGYGQPPGLGMHTWGPAAGLLGFLFVLLLVVAVVSVIVLLTRKGGGATSQQAPPTVTAALPANPLDEALSVAGKRYAKGEITKEQFEEIRDTLAGTSTPSLTA